MLLTAMYITHVTDSPDYPKEKKLITLSDYAEKYSINRNTVYRLLETGVLTRYIGVDGTPMLDPEELPEGVRKYQDRPGYEEEKTPENIEEKTATKQE
jgi:hypothetical protein